MRPATCPILSCMSNLLLSQRLKRYQASMMTGNRFEIHDNPVHRRRCLFPALLALFVLLSAPPSSAERLRILHTNDMHSHLLPWVTTTGDTVGGCARLATLLKAQEAAEPNHLYLDAGDLFQGTPFYNFFRGEAEMRVLSALGCDAMALGNHELDNGAANFLDKIREYGKFPVLCANVLVQRDSSRVPIGLPWTLLPAGNVRVGVIGVTTETLPLIVIARNIRDVTVEPVISHVQSLLPEVRSQSDVVVV